MADTERNIVIDIQTKTHQAVNDIKKLNREIDKLQRQNATFKKTTTQVNQMTRSFASLATHLGRLAVIYGAFRGLQTTVRTFGEFEQAVKRLGVISGATEGELALLEQRAKDLGESTIYTASQVTEGMNSMAMAGLNAQQQLAGIGSVLNVATIGMLTLEEASLITVRTMNAFGLEARDMAYITDIMATGATDSAQTVQQLGNAYEKVGAVATAFGHSIETTTASLELMADAGRVGSEAGTQLKIVMSRLAGNKEALKYIKELGTSMYDTNTKKLLPFKEQLVKLKEKLDALDDSAKNIKLSEIFGEEGKASAIILMNNLDKYDSKLKKLQGSYDSARQKAKEMQDTLVGAWKELQSALEGLSIKIGEDLTPVLRDLIEDATRFIQGLDRDEIANFTKSLVNLLGTLGTLTKVFVELIGSTASFAGSIQEFTGLSAGWVAVLGVVIIKLRGVLAGLLALATAHPILMAVTASLIAMDLAIVKIQHDLNIFTNMMQRNAKALDGFTELTNSFAEGFDNLTLAQNTKGLEDYSRVLKDLDYRIKSAEQNVRNYVSAQIIMTKEDVARVRAMKGNIRALHDIRDATQKVIDKLQDHGAVLQRQRVAEIKLINETRSAQNQLSTEAQYIDAKQQASLDKQIASLETRKVALEKTLGTMMTKERKYVNDLIKLEQEIANIRKKFSDEREGLALSIETRIANVRAKGLNDIQKYNNAQLRADKLLAQAKEALAKGNLEMAKAYLSEYNTLIEQSAGDEIKVDKKVKRTKGQTASEFIKDAKAGSLVMLGIINEEEKRELSAIHAKIEAKKLDIKMLIAQITLQKEMIVLMGRMIEQATGVKFQPDFTRFNDAITDAEAQLEALSTKQRKIKIDGDLSALEKDVDSVARDIERDTIEPVVEPDTSKAEIKMTGFIRDAESDILTPVNLDTTGAEKDDKKLRVLIKLPAGKAVNLETENAMSQDTRLINILSRPVIKIVDVHYRYHNPPQGYQVGGLIQQALPRYASGGLESGEGHSRKSGSLGGYGGGDKIKALLEAGEFIVRKEAVKALGLARLHAINAGQLPRYQHGGMVQPIQRFSTGGLTESNNGRKSGGTMELNLNIGGKTYAMIADEAVAHALARELQRGEF